MSHRITLIDGHPDPDPARFGHAVADAYASGAEQGGHQVRRIRLADLAFPVLRSRHDWEMDAPPPTVAAVQADLLWAQHLVIVHPLWLGAEPALLKALLEQIFRPGFAFPVGQPTLQGGLLKGRTARVVVTMGMPAFVYRTFYLSHSLKSLKRNILAFVGIGPTRETLIGNIEGIGPGGRRGWLDRIRRLGARGV
ncbi:MAG: NAD(P)H-dependent oxidoreductase [Brevundimonas sp.]